MVGTVDIDVFHIVVGSFNLISEKILEEANVSRDSSQSHPSLGLYHTHM